MSNTIGKLYAIGEQDDGILFVITNPLRVAKVTKDDINRYANSTGKPYIEAFGDHARASMKAILENDFSNIPANVDEVLDAFKSKIENGTTICDADFCFLADVKLDDLTHHRSIYGPVQGALEELTEDQTEPATNLRDALNRDE